MLGTPSFTALIETAEEATESGGAVPSEGAVREIAELVTIAHNKRKGVCIGLRYLAQFLWALLGSLSRPCFRQYSINSTLLTMIFSPQIPRCILTDSNIWCSGKLSQAITKYTVSYQSDVFAGNAVTTNILSKTTRERLAEAFLFSGWDADKSRQPI